MVLQKFRAFLEILPDKQTLICMSSCMETINIPSERQIKNFFKDLGDTFSLLWLYASAIKWIII